MVKQKNWHRPTFASNYSICQFNYFALKNILRTTKVSLKLVQHELSRASTIEKQKVDLIGLCLYISTSLCSVNNRRCDCRNWKVPEKVA